MARIPKILPPRPEPATAPGPVSEYVPLRPSRPAEIRTPVTNFQKPASEPFPERRFGGFEPAPDDMVALRFPIGENEETVRRIGLPVNEGLAGPAFREGNWQVSLLAQDTTIYRPEPKYTPLEDIADTRYLAIFKTKAEPFHLAKVFIGITNSDAVKAAFKQDIKGPCAIFWMADPEGHLFVGLDELEYLARIDGRAEPEGWYLELGIWPFAPEQQDFIDHFGDHIQKRRLECFGNPPLALVPCPWGASQHARSVI